MWKSMQYPGFESLQIVISVWVIALTASPKRLETGRKGFEQETHSVQPPGNDNDVQKKSWKVRRDKRGENGEKWTKIGAELCRPKCYLRRTLLFFVARGGILLGKFQAKSHYYVLAQITEATRSVELELYPNLISPVSRFITDDWIYGEDTSPSSGRVAFHHCIICWQQSAIMLWGWIWNRQSENLRSRQHRMMSSSGVEKQKEKWLCKCPIM